jgi:hypothetical protein
MYNIVIRVFPSGQFGTTLEFALGHSGELPRVIFRSSVVLPALYDESSSLRDLVEELAEDLFNVAAYAEGRRLAPALSSSGEEPQSSPQLLLTDEIDGGGWGGPAGDGQ